MTSPFFSLLLPALPATCDSNWNVRSIALKSAISICVLASTTPTRVTRFRSSPLATICVPTSISICPSMNSVSIFLCVPFRVTESKSNLTILHLTFSSFIISSSRFSICCVPLFLYLSFVLPHCSHILDVFLLYPQ